MKKGYIDIRVIFCIGILLFGLFTYYVTLKTCKNIKNVLQERSIDQLIERELSR